MAGLPVVPCLGLVWPGPVMPALPWPGPATTTGRLRRPAAASPPLLLLLDQAKARQARQAQARPSQGWAQQASQPSQSRGSRYQVVGYPGYLCILIRNPVRFRISRFSPSCRAILRTCLHYYLQLGLCLDFWGFGKALECLRCLLRLWDACLVVGFLSSGSYSVH